MVFDRAAATYDDDFTHSAVAQWLRERVWHWLDTIFQPGMRVLEIGCGTGEDALHLARHGVEVVATDASREMLAITQHKAQSVGVKLTCAEFDLNTPATWALAGPFDGVYSNFGPLNCTQNWPALGNWLANVMPSGGKLGFVMLSRLCLWESVWHAAHLDWHTATRRWSGEGIATLEDGAAFPVYYPSPRVFADALGPHFRQASLRGLGVFLPPSDSFGVLDSHQRMLKWLMMLETRLAHRWPWRGLGDHYWIELERK